MTRDEAIKIWDDGCKGLRGDQIDRFVALGMLKLDEPKLAPDRVSQMFEGIAMIKPSHLFEKLDAAGFKIVEK